MTRKARGVLPRMYALAVACARASGGAAPSAGRFGPACSVLTSQTLLQLASRLGSRRYCSRQLGQATPEMRPWVSMRMRPASLGCSKWDASRPTHALTGRQLCGGLARLLRSSIDLLTLEAPGLMRRQHGHADPSAGRAATGHLNRGVREAARASGGASAEQHRRRRRVLEGDVQGRACGLTLCRWHLHWENLLGSLGAR